MHCLGSGTGDQVSPNGFGSRGSVLSVVRALGVLVCEGRIQGPPRGYKEGPHCVPPLQSAPINHVCDKENYLCCRYLVLIREITERVAVGSYLCFEVVLCTDCSCGLIKSKSKHRVINGSPVTSWHHSSEMLLEYWCIGIVPSKNPETMNSQGLYQAVRSRLHFSQVAAWWSRSNGSRPSYVATRIVQPEIGDDHLRKFNESPVEHTFPLAGLGDGNSVKVTVWALPRMEDIPELHCPVHGGTSPEPVASPSNPETSVAPVEFVYYMNSFRSSSLLDDRLQIPCDKPGKHHCRCADEEDELEVATRVERKRRRSLPCRPPPPPQPQPQQQQQQQPQQQSQQEPQQQQTQQQPPEPDVDGLERSFRTQLTIDECNREKRYKRAEPEGPVNLVVNPLCEAEAKVHSTGKDLNGLMSRLSCSQEQPGILDWIKPPKETNHERTTNNLELSPREFDEVLAVLRARTPLGRRRAAVRTAKRREKYDRLINETQPTNKADVLLGAILRSSGKEPPKEEDSLPAAFNKRLTRLRQLFKREDEHRVKRRIDFEEENEQPVGTSANGQLEASQCTNVEDGDSKTSPQFVWVNHNNNNVVQEDGQEGGDKSVVPSAKDQERFRRSLENAASMVFHSRTGLPLTSSPAPLRRGSCCFDFDSSLNSVSSKRSALFELNTPPSPGAVSLEEGDRETESACDIEEVTRRRSTSRNRPQSHALLGSFEESALNGRLEPVSTIHGFTAEIGASGSFCPKHRKLPVTVFFYTLGDNDKVSSPYLAHINLGKKGYQVPRMGTIQVTLSNPLGTVVKMFVVLYDLTDMPARSHTFLRQRTLRDKTLRYLIHLRFMSGKTGRIYLHTDVRMIICRKSDVDTASDFGTEPAKELRSYIHGPTNPKFSPRC